MESAHLDGIRVGLEKLLRHILIVIAILFLITLSNWKKGDDVQEFLVSEDLLTKIVASPNIMYISKDNTIYIRGRMGVTETNIYYIDNFIEINNMPDAYALSQTVSFYYTQYIIKKDGTVWKMENFPPSATNDFSFTKIEGIENCIKICSGFQHTLALLGDGTVLAWGDNDFGQLGNGTNKSSEKPYKIKGLANIIDIASGGHHSLALDVGGNIYSWGRNSYGQLGNGHYTGKYINHDKKTPMKINGLAKATQVAAANSFSIALLENGTVWQWGIKSAGIVSPAFEHILKPEIVNDLKDAVEISANGSRAIALTKEGTIWQWGFDTNVLDASGKPPEIVNGIPKSIAIAAGYYTNVAITDDGSIWMWGKDVAIDETVHEQTGTSEEETPKCILVESNVRGEKLYDKPN